MHDIRYKIKLKSRSDFILTLFIDDVSESIFQKVLHQTRVKLQRKHNVDVKGDLDKVEEFTIPDGVKSMMFPVIYKALTKNMDIAIKEFEADGFKVLSINIYDVAYIKNKGGNWDI
jgi:hypothetical protein